MAKVTFFPGSISTEVSSGTSILSAAEQVGIQINAVCGGNGSCGKCIVIVDGEVSAERTGKVSEENWDLGYRLACQSTITKDVTVFIPEEASISEHKILTSCIEEELDALSPLSRMVLIDLPSPSIGDNIADLERIRNVISNEDIEVPLNVLRTMPRTLRESGWRSVVTLMRTSTGWKLAQLRPGTARTENYGIAIDIGTTTIVASLIDLSTGTTAGQASDYNNQIVLGEDVLTRIAYAEENGVQRLQKLVLETINDLTSELCVQREAKRRGNNHPACHEALTCMSVGGNTTMVHMFLGLDPRNIRYDPYIPITNVPPMFKASDLGLTSLHPEASVYCVPGRAGYVGGDVTADVLVSGMHKRDGISMLIDVGTNGEVVLGNKDWMVSCSTSAGPAFEGGEVSCGMRAMTGAIDSVKMVERELDITTINDSRPRGICGSGLIDLVAELFINGLIDKKGRIVANSSSRVRDSEHGREFVIRDPSEEDTEGNFRSRGIVVTDDDIINIIRTKAAIYAGCRVLLKSVDRTFEDVEHLYIAGGFGNFINIDNARTIGLLPDIPKERFVFMGNASLGGARLCLLSEDKRKEAKGIYDLMTYVELSTTQSFFDEFSSALFLPHTDISQFPSFGKRRA